MSQGNTGKPEKPHHKFKVFVCYAKEDCEKASVLEHMLGEKGFGAYMSNSESYGNFIFDEIKDMIRLSICFIAVLTSDFLNSSLINQEIGYAQGKGLKVILIVNDNLEEIQSIKTKLTVIEFNENNFRQQCAVVVDKVIKMAEILDEPVDFEAFLDFYSRGMEKFGAHH